MGVTCWGGGAAGEMIGLVFFFSKEMIRFHPHLVGIILKGRRSKVVKMVQVAPRGGGGLRVKLCKFPISSSPDIQNLVRPGI